MRIIEIGSGPGAAARAVAQLVGPSGHVLAIDRSAKAIAQLKADSRDEIAAGLLSARHAKIESFALEPDEARFDIAFAVRVGALDGRHADLQSSALACIARALKPKGRLFIDGGDPLRELKLPRA